MDFQNLGEHCSEFTCRQKDFLPFTCKYCTKIFCLDHRSTASHDCEKVKTGDTRSIVCPICLKAVKFDAGVTSENEKWEEHYNTECQPENYSVAKAKKAKTCEASNCKERLTTLKTYTCKNCDKELCLKHRYQDQHQCVKQIDNVIKEEKKRMENNENSHLSREEDEWDQRNDRNNFEVSPSVTIRNNTLWSMLRGEYIDPFLQSPYKSEIIFGVSLFSALWLLSKVVK